LNDSTGTIFDRHPLLTSKAEPRLRLAALQVDPAQHQLARVDNVVGSGVDLEAAPAQVFTARVAVVGADAQMTRIFQCFKVEVRSRTSSTHSAWSVGPTFEQVLAVRGARGKKQASVGMLLGKSEGAPPRQQFEGVVGAGAGHDFADLFGAAADP
jgi:hypothetical protein